MAAYLVQPSKALLPDAAPQGRLQAGHDRIAVWLKWNLGDEQEVIDSNRTPGVAHSTEHPQRNCRRHTNTPFSHIITPGQGAICSILLTFIEKFQAFLSAPGKNPSLEGYRLAGEGFPGGQETPLSV
jgi:hypothetical protein